MTSDTVLDWRVYEPRQLPRVLEAALLEFSEHGYDGTSIRSLAARAELSVPGVYHHHASKQEILAELLKRILTEVLERSRAALAEAEDTPVARFDALVESLLRFHMERRREALIASSELRALAPGNLEEYIALRDEQQGLIDDAVAAGVASGDFATPYPEDAARAVASMCIGVAAWYRRGGPLTVEQLIERNLVLARGLVHASH